MELNYKINERIDSKSVILISEEGHKHGVITRTEALQRANELSLDLIMVDEGENGIPICKIGDYGKLKYRLQKKNKGTHKQTTKEMNFNYNIAEHDLQVKHRKIREFIEDHHKVIYSMDLKGREKALLEDALKRFNDNLNTFIDVATWKEPSTSFFKNKARITSTLSPK